LFHARIVSHATIVILMTNICFTFIQYQNQAIHPLCVLCTLTATERPPRGAAAIRRFITIRRRRRFGGKCCVPTDKWVILWRCRPSGWGRSPQRVASPSNAWKESSGRRWRRRIHRLLRQHIIRTGRRHHLGDHDAHTFNQGQQDTTHHGRTRRSSGSGTRRQDATRGRPAENGIPGVLLLSNGGQSTIATGKDATPNGELSSQDGGTGLDGRKGSSETSSLGCHTCTLNGMPNTTTNISHAKGTADIVDDAPRTRLSVGKARLTRHLDLQSLL
jgi:hypothetical protein